MLSIPPHIYLIGAFIAWAGLMLTWTKHIREVSEARRLKAVTQGETAPDIKGVSNYERAELRESAHRAQHITANEKMERTRLIGRHTYDYRNRISYRHVALISGPRTPIRFMDVFPVQSQFSRCEHSVRLFFQPPTSSRCFKPRSLRAAS